MARISHHEPKSLDLLRRVPFVRSLSYTPVRQGSVLQWDGTLGIRTPQGSFYLVVEAKRSHVTRSAVSQLLAWLHHLPTGRAQGIMLLARHIPRPAAERLIEEKINFADDAGNVHLALGDTYNWTVIGMTAPAPASERRATSPAELQLLFEFVTHPDSLNWPVRRLESAAGISKSRAAQARRQMAGQGLLVRKGKHYQLGPANMLADRLVSGYAQVLRPKLVLGRFRAPEAAPEAFLARLRQDPPSGVRYALSGGPAAGFLQHFYHGTEVPLFLAPWASNVARQLRLLPDRDGPITIMNAFGEVVFWEARAQHMLAPPWLIYAELLSGNDSRAHEAAQEFRREFIP